MKRICLLIFLFSFFLFAPKVFASTIFQDNFQDVDGTNLSTHNSSWSFVDYGGTWGEYQINSNKAGSGTGSVYDIDKLSSTLTSHFKVTETFIFHPSIPSGSFMDIRLHDTGIGIDDRYLFRFWINGGAGATTLQVFPPNGAVTWTAVSGTFNSGGSNTISVEYSSHDFAVQINGATVLTFTDSTSTPDHIIISQSHNSALLTNFLLEDLVVVPTPTPTPGIIATSPSSSTVTVGTPFSIDVTVQGNVFNAAQATVGVSSNLSVLGLHNPTSGACNFQYTETPTTYNLSFAGAIYGTSSNSCKVYSLTLNPTATGTGTLTFTNGSIKAYADGSEILSSVQNGSFTIVNPSPTPTPTPPLSQLTVTSPEVTYASSFNLVGGKEVAITEVFVDGSSVNTTYPTSTTWQSPVTLVLGDNDFILYGKDAQGNQTATFTTTVNRHTLGDINGDGVVNIVDASLFAVDWGKTSNLTYILSDMNGDGSVNLTDLSILAKLES